MGRIITFGILLVVSFSIGGYFLINKNNRITSPPNSINDDKSINSLAKDETIIDTVPQNELVSIAENKPQSEQETEEANPQNDIAAQYASLAEYKPTTDSTIEDKMAFENQFMELTQEQLQRSQQAMTEDPEMRNMVNKVIVPLATGKWDEFLNEVDSVDQEGAQSPEMLAVYLMMAIQSNAPFHVIESLLQRGAKLSGETIQILAMFNNITLAQKLMPYGLDINAIGVMGDNALSTTAKIKSNKEMFYFLLQHQINPNPPYNGLDALDYLLRWINEGSVDVIPMIKALLDHGAHIERSHREAIQQLAINSPETYQQLINQAPALIF